MRLRSVVRVLVVPALTFSSFHLPGQENQGPIINEKFPIRSGAELSPPIVSPVGECAQAVHVSGFLPHAFVRVYLNGVTQIGAQHPYFAEADIPLTQALVLGDKVSATQEVNGFTSAQSVDPVVVGPYPPLNTPVVGPDLFACGRIVPVNDLNPGTHVDVFRNGGATPFGIADATQAWQPVFTASLNAGDHVTARQTACPAIPSKKVVSPTSAPVNVQTSPAPPPAPTLEPYPVGVDAVVLDGLSVGASVQVLDHGSPAGGGFATASRNRAPLDPHATSSSSVSATQTLCTSSPPSTPQPPSTTLNAPVLVPPICEGTHYVTVQNTYPNSIVVLFRNGTIAGMAGGILGNLKMALGGGATFAEGDEVHVIQYVVSVISPASNSLFADCDKRNVITQHNDNSRSGAYPAETHLTPANVNPATFGLLYKRNVDGGTMSQPLYMRQVHTAMGKKNLILVTTEKNNVYAFDADNPDPDPTHGLVWQRNLCSSVPSTVCGETPSHLVGITSTPVIDPNTETMYVLPRCSDGSGGPNDGADYIHALNLSDGSDRVPRVQINATDPHDSTIHFDFHCQRQRPGLLLSQHVVYAGFATFSCDAGCASAPYRGWILGYRDSDLKQVAVFDTSPTKGGVGVWQTGNGLVASSDGSIYFETGNGDTAEPLQDSFVKLTPTGPSGLTLASKFSPNDAVTLSNGDTDLGSGGPMLLPHGRLIGGGKQGRYYVLDAGNVATQTQDTAPDSLGYDGFQAFINTYHNDSSKPACVPAGGAAGCNPTAPTTDCFIDPKRYSIGELCGPNIHGGPIFLQTTATSGVIYEMPEKDFLKGFKYEFTTHHVTEMPALTATGTLSRPPTDGMPGGFSSVSANGMSNGIVWTLMPDGDGQWNAVPGRIAAFDASNLHQLWSDSDNVVFAKSVPPTVADGKVVRATWANQVYVYGLLNQGGGPGPRKFPCYNIAQKYLNYGSETGLLGTRTGQETPIHDNLGGSFQNFTGSIPGITSSVTSKRMPRGAQVPTCSMEATSGEPLASAIYFSPLTCAHVVEGEILKLWRQLGETRSKLGYPISDEEFTDDGRGRVSIFQHGQIIWYPEQGARVAGAEGCEDVEKDCREHHGSNCEEREKRCKADKDRDEDQIEHAQRIEQEREQKQIEELRRHEREKR